MNFLNRCRVTYTFDTRTFLKFGDFTGWIVKTFVCVILISYLITIAKISSKWHMEKKETFNYFRWELTEKKGKSSEIISQMRKLPRYFFRNWNLIRRNSTAQFQLQTAEAKKNPFLPCWSAIMLIKFLTTVKLFFLCFYSISNDAFGRRENFPVFSRLWGFLIEVKCLQSSFISHESWITIILS